MIHGRVVKRAKDNEGRPIGRRHDNPLLDSREYEVALPDGSTGQHTANVFLQVDKEGWQYARRMRLRCLRMKVTLCPITGGGILLADGRSKLSGRMVPRTGY